MKTFRKINSVGLMTMLLLATLSFSAFTMAQSDHSPEAPFNSFAVDTRASFGNSDASIYDYIGDNIVYPEDLRSSGYEAKVTVAFVVDRKGNVVSANVKNSECYLKEDRSKRKRGHSTSTDRPEVCTSCCDQFESEALNVISDMPNWTPATLNGKNVPMTFSIPITFKIQN